MLEKYRNCKNPVGGIDTLLVYISCYCIICLIIRSVPNYACINAKPEGGDPGHMCGI